MALENDVYSLIQYYLENNFSEESAESLQERRKRVDFKVARLQQIKKQLQDQSLIISKRLSRRTLLYYILNTKGVTFNAQAFAKIQDAEEGMQVQKIIFEVYELTSQVFADLGLIAPIRYTFIYQDPDTGTFYRSSDLVIDPEKDLTVEIRHSRSLVALRLKESAIKTALAEKIRSQEDQQWANDLSGHYYKFIAPFLEAQERAQKAAATSGKKKYWKMNQGVAAEAFERHLENLGHLTGTPMTDADIGSVGERWILYKQSSGNDPYFTGPDTEYSQVKGANASIISNIETVLNALEAVLKIASIETSQEGIKDIADSYRKSFMQKEFTIKNISKDLANAMGEAALEEVRQIIKNQTNTKIS